MFQAIVLKYLFGSVCLVEDGGDFTQVYNYHMWPLRKIKAYNHVKDCVLEWLVQL